MSNVEVLCATFYKSNVEVLCATFYKSHDFKSMMSVLTSTFNFDEYRNYFWDGFWFISSKSA